MTYIERIVSQIVRLLPAIANNSHMAVRETILPVGGGEDGMAPLLVSMGATIFFSAEVMDRRTEL